MQTHKLNKKAIAVTGLPGTACDLRIDYGSCVILSWANHGRGADAIELPPGNWRILGFAQDLEEEHWKLVIEKVDSWGKTYFKNYTSPHSFDEGLTATKSGYSLLKAEGVELLNTLILIQ